MRIQQLLIFCLVLFFVNVANAAPQTDSVWNGGNGDWNVDGNWSPVGVPNGAFNVFIDDGGGGDSLVHLPNSTAFTVDSLTIDVGDGLQLNNFSRLTIQTDINRPDSGKIFNDGNILVSNSGSTTHFYIENDVVLSGLGSITLGGSASVSRISDPSNRDGVLTNVDNLIQGKGNIGANSLQVINQAGGLIAANDPSGTLTLDPRDANPMINMGVLQATGGGTLIVTGNGGGGIDNTGGFIEALPGSAVHLTGNGTVIGGTLQTFGDGIIDVLASQNVFLTDVTIDGTVRQNNFSDLYLDGNITNLGNGIHIDNAGSTTKMYVDHIVTLDGGGTITLEGSAAVSRIADPSDGDGVLTNIDNLIQGKGNIGANSLQVINLANGLIDANDPTGALTLDPRDADPMINMGIMQASGGGTMIISGNGGGFVDNSGGIIEAMPGSSVHLTSNGTITGGILQTSGDGTFEVMASQNVFLTDVTIDGTLRQNNFSDLYLDGTVTNLGNSIHIDNAGSTTKMYVDTNVTLDGGGTITLQGSAAVSRIADPADRDGVLTNVDNLIQGKGEIGANTLQVINEADGLIDANDTTGSLTIDPRDADPMINRGTMQASGGGSLVISGNGGGFVDNTDGLIEAQTGSTVALTDSASVVGGTLKSSGSGTFEVPASRVATLTDLTVDGVVNQNNFTDLFLAGMIVNNGEFNVLSAGSATDLTVNAPVLITGPGSINLPHLQSRINGGGEIDVVGGSVSGVGLVNVPGTFNGATVIPGNSVGALRFSGTTTMLNQTRWDMELGAVAGSPGTDWDHIDVTGTLEFEDPQIPSGVVIAPTTLDLQGMPGLLDGFDPNQNYSWQIASASSLSGYDSSYITIDASEFANPHDGLFGVTSNGNDLSLTYDPASTVVNANSMNIVVGSQTGGDLSDTNTSDNSYLEILSGNPFSVTSPTIWIDFEGVLPTDTPSALAFKIETSVTNNDITQKLEMYNYQTGRYEEVDRRVKGINAESVVELVVAGDVTRFVEPGTGAVKTRVTYFDGPSSIFLRWSVKMDQLAWVVPQ